MAMYDSGARGDLPYRNRSGPSETSMWSPFVPRVSSPPDSAPPAAVNNAQANNIQANNASGFWRPPAPDFNRGPLPSTPRGSDFPGLRGPLVVTPDASTAPMMPVGASPYASPSGPASGQAPASAFGQIHPLLLFRLAQMFPTLFHFQAPR